MFAWLRVKFLDCENYSKKEQALMTFTVLTSAKFGMLWNQNRHK